MAVAAWLGALAAGVIGGQLIALVAGYSDRPTAQWPVWLTSVATIPLWIGMMIGALAISRGWGTASLRRDYGFQFARTDLVGLPIGVALQLIMVPFVFLVMRHLGIDTKNQTDPAKQLTDKARGIGVVILVVLVVVGAPLVEELFFRGLLLRSIQARYSDTLALVGSALAFAAAHFQLLQFPALAIFGLVVGYAAQRTRRIGLGIFIHAGFNATTVVLLLADR